MHVLYTIPLNLKGKMHDTLGVAPPTVMHKDVLLTCLISVKNKTEICDYSKRVNCEYFRL